MSDWAKVGKVISKAAPLLGGLLGGPVGLVVAGAGKLLAGGLGCEETPEAVLTTLSDKPELFVKVREIEANKETELAKLAADERRTIIEAGSKDLATINQTMQGEGQSDKWWVSGWRPYNGFLFGTTMFCVYFVLPLLFGLIKAFAESKPNLTVPVIDYWVWLAWASVLGVTSWHRGMKQRLESGEVGKPGIIGAIANRIKR